MEPEVLLAQEGLKENGWLIPYQENAYDLHKFLKITQSALWKQKRVLSIAFFNLIIHVNTSLNKAMNAIYISVLRCLAITDAVSVKNTANNASLHSKQQSTQLCPAND